MRGFSEGGTENTHMGKEQIIGEVLKASPAMLKRIEAAIRGDEQGRRKAQSEEDKRLVSFAATARLLNIGRSSVYRLVSTSRLDAIDMNGSRKITMRSIHAFLNGERPANEKTAELVAASKARYATGKAEDGSEAQA